VNPTFFPSADDFRSWLAQHHGDYAELLVGFRKVGSGLPSISYGEAVDQALCYGWIDGVRKRIDETSYTIRFTPRRPGSTWSAVNIKRAQELAAQGLMSEAGSRAFETRTDENSAIYSYEQRHVASLDPQAEATFEANAKAWTFFQAQPPSYRRAAVWWVISAKREETRQKRLATLIADSERGRTIAPLTRPGGTAAAPGPLDDLA
jgi:uncharacterized protein YdeI (YjbR/CyaY-like superfamily)